MKKGLLSLLALALTVVGCQNYDDQFAELTSQITDLQSTVDGLTSVSSAISSLQTTVAGISSALSSVQTSVGSVQTTVNGLSNYDDAAVVAQLATISQTLADLAASLNGVATAGDLDSISSTLAGVQADVRELLGANATISQAILINSSASLQYVESLISTGTDDPNVIVNNTVTIDTGSLTDSEKSRANEVAAKIATVIGDVTITGDETITMSELVYVDGDYVVTGADHSEPKLASITGDLVITQELKAPLSFVGITSVANIVAKGTTLATATSIDLSGVTVSGDVGTGAVTNTLTATQATGIVDLGTVDNFATITADLASQVIIDDAAAYPTALRVNAAVAGSIDITAATSIGGTFTVRATDTTVLNANSLTGTLTADIDTIGTANLAGVKEITGTMDAENAVLTALTHLGASGTVNMDGLTTVNLPNVIATTNQIGMGAATSVTLATINDLDFSILDDLVAGVTRSLTLAGQTTQVSLTATAQAANLKTLDITLAGAAATGIDAEVSATNSITHLRVAGTGREVNVNSNTGLVTLTTAGFINDFTAETLAALNSLDIDHTYTSDFTRPFNFTVNDVDQITSLNLSSLNKVFNLFIVGNAALANITAPANSTPITPDALNGTTPNIQVTGNSVVATYTNATATIPSDGINPATAFVSSTIESASLESIKDFILANVAVVATTSYTIDWDVAYGTSPVGFDAAIAADCDGQAGADNTLGVRIGTGSTCTGATSTAADDADRGNIDAGYITASDELAIIN